MTMELTIFGISDISKINTLTEIGFYQSKQVSKRKLSISVFYMAFCCNSSNLFVVQWSGNDRWGDDSAILFGIRKRNILQIWRPDPIP